MTRQAKSVIIESLAEQFRTHDYFYVVDAIGLSVAETNEFRKKCSQAGVTYQVAKNTLVAKALEQIKTEVDYTAFTDTVLRGFSGVLFVQETASTPAKIVQDFRKQKKLDRPILKGASVDGDLFIGEEHLEALSKLKSKAELLGEVITLLASPMKNVIKALHSSKEKLASVIKALAAR